MRLCSENVAQKCGGRAFLWVIVNMTVMDMNLPPEGATSPHYMKKYAVTTFKTFSRKNEAKFPKDHSP